MTLNRFYGQHQYQSLRRNKSQYGLVFHIIHKIGIISSMDCRKIKLLTLILLAATLVAGSGYASTNESEVVETAQIAEAEASSETTDGEVEAVEETDAVVTKTESPRKNNFAPDFSRYQVILDRMPFGTPAQLENPRNAAATNRLAEMTMTRQIRLCAVTRTEQGVAAGLIDSSYKPPRNYYLYVGDEMDDLKLVSASVEEETAVIERNGVQQTFTLTGVKTAAAPPTAGNTNLRPGASASRNTTESRLPPTADSNGSAAIPLPATAQRPITPRSSLSISPMSARIEEMRKTREDIAKIRESGGDVGSYMSRLRERRAKESAERAEAEKSARESLQDLARQLTADELAKREREINLKLIEQGSPPLSEIVLTPEEEKALVEKGVLQ